MHRRHWDANTKAIIVIQGLQGKPVAVICNDYQLSQSPYDQWWDQFLAHASHAFEGQQRCRAANSQHEADSAPDASTSMAGHSESAAESQTDANRQETSADDQPNAWWAIDMTKVLVEGFGWVYIVIVLDLSRALSPLDARL